MMIWSALKSRLLSLLPRRARATSGFGNDLIEVGALRWFTWNGTAWVMAATPDMMPLTSPRLVRVFAEDDQPLVAPRSLTSSDDEIWRKVMLAPFSLDATPQPPSDPAP